MTRPQGLSLNKPNPMTVKSLPTKAVDCRVASASTTNDMQGPLSSSYMLKGRVVICSSWGPLHTDHPLLPNESLVIQGVGSPKARDLTPPAILIPEDTQMATVGIVPEIAAMLKQRIQGNISTICVM